MLEVKDAIKDADVCMILVPDELQADLYENFLKDNLKNGSALLFARGLAIHFQLIKPREDLDVFMIAPKGPGHTVRGQYQAGAGVMSYCDTSRCIRKCLGFRYILRLSNWWRTFRYHPNYFQRGVRDRSFWRASSSMWRIDCFNSIRI